MLNQDLSQQLGQYLDHDWIAEHIPHQGNMCLLKNVQSWDEEKIICIADSHRALDNPLRAHDRLGIACGVEYAAQAMAVHGALLAQMHQSASIERPPVERPKVGYLISVRGVSMFATRLDDVAEDLILTATCVMAGESNMLYQFSVSANHQTLLEGRAAVVLDAGSLVNMANT